jgi:hypothetical protein
MNRPQQPELARSRRSATDPASAKAKVIGPPTSEGRTGPIPEENLPGHHPEHEQDKPEGPPRRSVRRTFGFAFEPRMLPFAAAVGVTPFTAKVEVVQDELRVRFGPWSLRTPVDNVEAAEVTGPYAFPKVVGPPHLSLADRGVTFATTTRRGVCLRFREPVAAALPFGLLRHPAATVTVDRPEELAAALEA